MCLNPLLTIKKNGKVFSLKQLARMQQQYNKEFYEGIKSNEIIELNCGKCAECQKENYMEWLNKIKKEIKLHLSNYMLNLTYDDNNKKNLNKEDLQLFFKRLRKKYKFRYFYVGELGETTERPHYHILMFGLEKPKDLTESKRPTKRKNKQYESKEIEKIWGKGLITLNEINIQTIHYVLKYLTKNKDKKEFIFGYSTKPPLGVNPNTISKDIMKTTRTKAEKTYYKNHFGEIPILENEEFSRENKIQEIEKQTKLKYLKYINQKRQP